MQSIMLRDFENSNQKFKPILIVLVYCPLNGNNRMAFKLTRHNYINSIDNLDKMEVDIFGDMHLNYADQNCLGYQQIEDIS